MHVTIGMYLLVCPFLFLAGFVDAIGGGGGLISLPAYLLAGLPPHTAIATNKFSSTCGTALATARFIKNGLINLKLAFPSVLFGIVGSYIGARLSLYVSEALITRMMLFILPVAAFIVLNRNIFHDNPEAELVLNIRTYGVSMLAALIIGLYDGFYGPGTGTFLIIAFTVLAGMSMKQANGQTKAINLTTNITALSVFLLHGEVLLTLGIAGAVSNMIGGYLGSGMVMKKGSKIVKPIILFVLTLLFLKILSGS